MAGPGRRRGAGRADDAAHASACTVTPPSSTLTTRGNLAYAYQTAGDLGRAIPQFEQALADCVRVLGEDHPQTKIVRDSLATARQQSQ